MRDEVRPRRTWGDNCPREHAGQRDQRIDSEVELASHINSLPWYWRAADREPFAGWDRNREIGSKVAHEGEARAMCERP